MLARATKCPCCGQDMPATAAIVVDEATFGVHRLGTWVYLTPRQFSVFHSLHRAKDKALSMDLLIHAVYGNDPDGGPEDPRTVIHVMITQANRRLRAINLVIQRDRKGAWFSSYRIRVL